VANFTLLELFGHQPKKCWLMAYMLRDFVLLLFSSIVLE